MYFVIISRIQRPLRPASVFSMWCDVMIVLHSIHLRVKWGWDHSCEVGRYEQDTHILQPTNYTRPCSRSYSSCLRIYVWFLFRFIYGRHFLHRVANRSRPILQGIKETVCFGANATVQYNGCLPPMCRSCDAISINVKKTFIDVYFCKGRDDTSKTAKITLLK